jgi:type VI secretion system protein ImpC
MAYELDINGVRYEIQLPFVTGVMADLSGEPEQPLAPVADRPFVEIDRPRFDAVMASMHPRVVCRVLNTLTGEGELAVDICFNCLADFEPAQVIQQVEPLRKLLEARQRLVDSAADSADGAGDESGVSQGTNDQPELSDILAEIDARLSEQLNQILHDPKFQQLESVWRGLHLLVAHTDADEQLKIKVLNISKKELHKTLKKFKGTAWDQSPIFKKINASCIGSLGGEPFGCLVGDYYFDHNPQDVELLSGMAQICAATHTLFLSAVSPSIMNMDSWEEVNNPRDLLKIFTTPEYVAWRSLRESEDARYLGLSLPRFLVRPPYDFDTCTDNGFHIDEDIQGLMHSKFLWASSAYVMAINIHRSFQIHGWFSHICGLESGGAIEGLPRVSSVGTGGLEEWLCPTEVAISDRRESELARAGFNALVHRQGSDIAVFVGACSLAEPGEYDDPDATANAQLSVRLPYVLAVARLGIYIRAMVRDKSSILRDRDSLQAYLDRWIADYVDRNPATPNAFFQSPRPFAAVEVVVEEQEYSDHFSVTFHCKPAAVECHGSLD